MVCILFESVWAKCVNCLGEGFPGTGCDPLSGGCMFQVCSGTDSCTKDTTLGTGPWLGTGQNFTVRVFLVVLIEVTRFF